MGDDVRRVWIVGLTQNTVRVRGTRLSDTEPVEIEIDGVGSIRAVVSSPSDDGARLLLEPTPQQYDALLRRFYASGDAPGVTQTRYRGLVADLARRLSSTTGD
jgi:cellulose synthase (UDP-forming)